MFKYTKHFLKKTEDLFSELEYIIRYERGSFQSGYCIVEDRRIAVINKFFDTEARINTLIEILGVIEVNTTELSEQGLALYKILLKSMADSNKKTAETDSLKESEETDLEEQRKTAIEEL